MSVSIRGSFLRGLRITTSGDVVPYFLLDNFNGTGSVDAHTADSGTTWADVTAGEPWEGNPNIYLLATPSNFVQRLIPQTGAIPVDRLGLLIQAIINNSSRLIAAVSTGESTVPGGLFVSDDNGVTWVQKYSSDFINVQFGEFAVNGSKLSIGRSDGKVFYSTDNGDTWSVNQVYLSALGRVGINYVAYNSGLTKLVMTSDSNSSLFYTSADDGATWSQIADNGSGQATLVNDRFFTPIRYSFGRYYTFDYTNFVLYTSPDGVSGNWSVYSITNSGFVSPLTDPNDNVVINNCWQVGNNIFAITVGDQFIAGSSGSGSNIGIWKFTISLAAVPSISAGTITGVLISDILGDAKNAGNVPGVQLGGISTSGSSVIVDDTVLLFSGSGAGYPLSYLSTASNTSTENSNRDFTTYGPFEWVVGVQSSFPTSMFYDSGNLYGSGGLGASVTNIFQIGSGYTGSGSSVASTSTSFAESTLSGGNMQLQSSYASPNGQSALIMMPSLPPPSGNFYVEVELNLNISSIRQLFNLYLLSADSTFYNIFIEQANDSSKPDTEFIVGAIVFDSVGNATQRWPLDQNQNQLIASAGTGATGVYTLRLEITDSYETWTVKLNNSTIFTQNKPATGISGLDYGSLSIGSGYTSGTYLAVAFVGTGTGATGDFYVQSGEAYNLSLTSAGDGFYTDGIYQNLSTTNISATGTGLIMSVVVSGGVITDWLSTFASGDPGSGHGYTAGDTITVNGIGGGTGLVITIDTVQDYMKVVLKDPGTGYPNADPLTVNDADIGGGSGFTINANVAPLSQPTVFDFGYSPGWDYQNISVAAIRGGSI